MPEDTPEAAQRALGAARERQRRASLGPPLDQSDADRDALATVSPADLAASEACIRDANGPFGADLFRAKRDG